MKASGLSYSQIRRGYYPNVHEPNLWRIVNFKSYKTPVATRQRVRSRRGNLDPVTVRALRYALDTNTATPAQIAASIGKTPATVLKIWRGKLYPPAPSERAAPAPAMPAWAEGAG